MANIYWLDDEANRTREVLDGAAALRHAGHNVTLFTSEEILIDYLQKNDLPSLVIQDLLRPPCQHQIIGGRSRKKSENSFDSGWRLYQEILKPYFPQLPVVICSFDAGMQRNLRKADDFNLELYQKSTIDKVDFAKDIDRLLRAQSTILSSKLILPEIVIVELQEVNSRLIEHLVKNPQDLHAVSWSNFELLLAELLRQMRYEVVHTPLSRDGGVDLWALRRDDLSDTLYAIDAKKYAPNKIIGPEPVRAIYGVSQMKGANVGMIVTTARFGPAALELQSQYRHQISLKDFDAVAEWLRKASAGKK